jgi:single-stranded-DNA-specific exonuclease
VKFGGHQAAAGVEVRPDGVAALREAWNARCAVQGAEAGPSASLVEADVRLDDRDDPAAVVHDLERLEPCGEGNRAPRLLIRGAPVVSTRLVKGHLKLEVRFGRRVIGAFGFQQGALADLLVGGSVDLIGKLRRDTWRGGDEVELRIERVARTEG